MTDTTKTKYCFDTDALVSSWRIHYRHKSFEELWEHLGNLMKTGSIIICEEVQKEVGVGKDDLVLWLKQHKACVKPLTKEQLAIATEIVNRYPLVSQYHKPRPNHADPFVVALAKIEKCTVVTYEARNGSKDHPKVPDLCKEYGVDSCTMSAFFEKEGIVFGIKK